MDLSSILDLWWAQNPKLILSSAVLCWRAPAWNYWWKLNCLGTARSRILAPILDHAKNLENNRPIDNLTNNATTTMRAAVINNVYSLILLKYFTEIEF